MHLSDLTVYDKIVIQCHDNPDADALGAGFGLYNFFADRQKEVYMVYGGRNRIQKTNLKLMIEKLEIPIEYIKPGTESYVDGLLIMVDCQYDTGNAVKLQAEEIAVIDHHPPEKNTPVMKRIQTNLGSCATLVWQMLNEEGYGINDNVRLGTALYYALYSDTNQFAELFHPLDMDMLEAVTYNKRLLKLFRNSNISLEELEIAGTAMIRYDYNEEYRFAVIRTKPCDPNILGLISDFLLQVDGIDTCVVYNEGEDGYKLSVRSCIKEVNANELAAFLTCGIGSGGGHYEKAGGFISAALYEAEHQGRNTESYFRNKMIEYYRAFELIYAAKLKPDIGGMEEYYRIKEPVCYVRTEEFCETGERLFIRSAMENTDVDISQLSCLVLERDGSIRCIPEEIFSDAFTATEKLMDESYYEKMAYIPTIREGKSGRVYSFLDYGRKAVPREEFHIYAKELNGYVKLFTRWEEEKYMLGMPGDYLVVSAEKQEDIFIEAKEKFLKKFRKI